MLFGHNTTINYNILTIYFKQFLQGKAGTFVFSVLLSFPNVSHHCFLSDLIWPHSANSEYEINRKTLAL